MEKEAEDLAYFAKRAREEVVRAVTCENNVAASAHLTMAAEYKNRISRLAILIEIAERG